MKTITGKTLTGERAAYSSTDTRFCDCVFKDGESPLKECRNIRVSGCSFLYKYPLWYCKNVTVENTEWFELGRSGLWYTNNVTVKNSLIGAPKQFRRCSGVKLCNCKLPLAQETMWHCNDIELKNVEIAGDYFGMNCKGVTMQNVKIDGNYCFDGGSDIVARDCVFLSKDSFWNCSNVTLYNCVIVGEYLGWNSKNLSFTNCSLEAHQGLCYISGLKLKNCKIENTDLAFELCSDIDADITTRVDSIKNPINGIIRCKGTNELILDEKVIDPENTVIEFTEEER